mmetsp:Transcript_15839/g.24562  ORF Transcript_15839/g.24562 Transcript_15839/m.24562 type:complete len:109 (-) Transcript_15839:74-400(-)
MINMLIDNAYESAGVLQQVQTDQPEGRSKSGIEGEGESSEGSSGDTDSESSDEETASSSEDNSIREVGTASGGRENWKLQETMKGVRGKKRGRQSERCRRRRRRKEWS